MKQGTLLKLAAAALIFSAMFSLSVPAGAEGLSLKYNMSYIYFGDSSRYASHVKNTKNSLDEISPNYFNLNNDGSLNITTAADMAFIRDMHDSGVRVVPFLSNHWDRELGRQALRNKEALVGQIVDAVKVYELDGVNVDIENLTEEDRDSYTAFVKLLREKLPSGKVLSVAVAPNPWGLTKGWQGSYDYKALGKHSDYLMIMAYDEHYQGGPAGPVSSASFVENSIKYALKYVPKDKVVLGIPFYGRYWQSGKSYGGYGVSLTDVEKLIAKYRGKILYDWASQSPKATITIKSGDVKPYLFGKKLEAGTYTIWFENEQSIKYKLGLVQKYGIKGTGSWSLGQETKNIWDFYSLWLNGFYFYDAQGSWAQGSILSVAARGWMKGISSTSFAPNNNLTRAETAAVLVRAFGLDGKDSDDAFSDISNHWARDEINIAARHEIILGREDGTFGPDEPVTRQEIAVMLDRILLLPEGKTAVTVNPYTDVSPGKYPWSYDSIVRMTQHGIFSGRPDGAFYPLDRTLRSEMAALMERVAGFSDNSGAVVG